MSTHFDPFIKRICKAAQAALHGNEDGTVVITVRVVMGKDNRPILWAVSDCIRLEPTYKVDAFLEAISGSLAGTERDNGYNR